MTRHWIINKTHLKMSTLRSKKVLVILMM